MMPVAGPQWRKTTRCRVRCEFLSVSRDALRSSIALFHLVKPAIAPRELTRRVAHISVWNAISKACSFCVTHLCVENPKQF
jgi:hypothetical protein